MKIKECVIHPGKPEYNEKRDAHFCMRCDVWLEKNCGDVLCVFCNNRPVKPSEERTRTRFEF